MRRSRFALRLQREPLSLLAAPAAVQADDVALNWLDFPWDFYEEYNFGVGPQP